MTSQSWNENKRKAAATGQVAWRNNPAYKRARLVCLNRDHWRCQLGFADICQRKANTVHHKGGVTDANLCDLSIMVAACKPCNTRVGRPGASNPHVVRRTQWTRAAVETS